MPLIAAIHLSLRKSSGVALAGEQVLEVARAVGALDDLGHRVVAADAVDQVVVRGAVALGDEDVAGPPEVARRFAQRAAGQQRVGAERRLAVDQHDVDRVAEAQVLHAVVEDQGVGAEFADREQAALDAVLVDDHGDLVEVAGEHVGLVAGVFRVEQRPVAGADQLGHLVGGHRLAVAAAQPLLRLGELAALVAAAEHGDPAAAVAQGAGEQLDHRGLAGAADGEVADADHLGAEVALADDPVAVRVSAGRGRPAGRSRTGRASRAASWRRGIRGPGRRSRRRPSVPVPPVFASSPGGGWGMGIE